VLLPLCTGQLSMPYVMEVLVLDTRADPNVPLASERCLECICPFRRLGRHCVQSGVMERLHGTLSFVKLAALYGSCPRSLFSGCAAQSVHITPTLHMEAALGSRSLRLDDRRIPDDESPVRPGQHSLLGVSRTHIFLWV
jgi:hypothetical protein